MRSLSFRGQLAIAMGAIIVLISAAMWVYVPRVLEREAVALAANKADSLARLTAFTIHPAIYFQDRAALDEALSGARRDQDVAYLIVTDPAGNRLAAYHPERATGHSGLSADRSLYEVTLPIRDGQRPLATLSLGLSLARLQREISDMRFAIGALIAVVSAAGLAAVLLISHLLTRPLREVAEGAQRIAAGDLALRVPVHGDDEIGRLGSSFNHMAAKIAQRDTSLREMSKRLLSVQEEERIRIAREVHDELGQALTSLKIDLQQTGARDAARKIDHIVDLVRRIAFDLRPAILDDLGITAALEQQLRRLRESSGISTTLHVPEEPELDSLTRVTLYRIAQEGLANVIRHAVATEVAVSLRVAGGTAVLEIRDNGRGIEEDRISSALSLGLVGMRERAELLGGDVAITSRSGEGTVVTVTLPVGGNDRHAASALR
ncbi:MAG TPA: HAMP domain-containing protein [Thermoanaerobaculia bacterium]|nr:HAMP domain-containing protein [Thermoanaerobaculia bacterium]